MTQTAASHRPGTVKAALALLGAGLLAGLWTDNARRARAAEAKHPPPGRFVEVAGGRLHVIDEGDGPPLVLLHGAAFMAGDMLDGELGDRLMQRYRVVAVDRPGHGFSDEFPLHMAPQHQARLVREAMRRLGVRRPILLGHSLGGAVALAYALEFPDEVAGVVALSPQAFPDGQVMTVAFGTLAVLQAEPLTSRTLWPPVGRQLIGPMVRQAFAPQRVPREFWQRAPFGLLTRPMQLRANGLEMLTDLPAMQLLSRRYRGLRVPLAVIVGSEDRVLAPEEQGVRLARTVPGAALIRLPGLGHMPHHFAPDAIVGAVRDICARAGVDDCPCD